MGVSPPPLGSPQCDNPREGNNSTIALRRGGPEVTGTVPSFKACVFFCAIIKGILQSTKNYFADAVLIVGVS